jgi:hypothetical protein
MATDDFSPAQFSESNCLNMGRKLLQNIAPAATSWESALYIEEKIMQIESWNNIYTCCKETSKQFTIAE